MTLVLKQIDYIFNVGRDHCLFSKILFKAVDN